jgi:ribosomal protein S18 acetylase RimI-like enzyme
MSVEVRRAKSEEYDEAGEATASAYREFIGPGDEGRAAYLQEIADVRSRADRAVILVAVEEGEILGSATLELDTRIDDDHGELGPDQAHIRMLGVKPAARRRGAAKALMQACEDEALGAGKAVLTLNTTQMMVAAQRMYESLGFERMPDTVYPDGFVLLAYRKKL